MTTNPWRAVVTALRAHRGPSAARDEARRPHRDGLWRRSDRRPAAERLRAGQLADPAEVWRCGRSMCHERWRTTIRARRRLLFDDLLEFQVGVGASPATWGRRSNAPVLPTTAKIDARIRRLFPFSLTVRPELRHSRHHAPTCSRAGRCTGCCRPTSGRENDRRDLRDARRPIAAQASGGPDGPDGAARDSALADDRWLPAKGAVSAARLLTGQPYGVQAPRDSRAARDRASSTLSLERRRVIQEAVTFSKLGMAVIDEQHKFGVAAAVEVRWAGQHRAACRS